MTSSNPSSFIKITKQLGKWLVLSLIVAGFSGSASALFLLLLDQATNWREAHLWVIWFLPLGGFVVGWIYHKYGSNVESGNNLLLDEIHDPKSVVPLRMAPLILFSTIATHFFGGSAGREGTAVQMGGSLADQLTKPFRLSAHDRRILLMAGISAGFSSVFGTPLAGALFGLEVLAIGKIRYDALFPCFISAVLADYVTRALGIHHANYFVSMIPSLNFPILIKTILAGSLFGLTGLLFAKLTHTISNHFKKRVSYGPLRPFIGGLLFVVLIWFFKAYQYLGLGLPTIAKAFTTQLSSWDFILKLLFTALTLGAGFKGGEVTPLFFIGAALGNSLAPALALPSSFLAGIGFVAVFAGAANTPITCTLMAMELFGAPIGIYAGIACVVSFLFSGHAGIYHSQKPGISKIHI